jgi:hypothetical protein
MYSATGNFEEDYAAAWESKMYSEWAYDDWSDYGEVGGGFFMDDSGTIYENEWDALLSDALIFDDGTAPVGFTNTGAPIFSVTGTGEAWQWETQPTGWVTPDVFDSGLLFDNGDGTYSDGSGRNYSWDAAGGATITEDDATSAYYPPGTVPRPKAPSSGSPPIPPKGSGGGGGGGAPQQPPKQQQPQPQPKTAAAGALGSSSTMLWALALIAVLIIAKGR